MKTNKQHKPIPSLPPMTCSALFYRFYRAGEKYPKTIFDIYLTPNIFYNFNPSWIQLAKLNGWRKEEPKQIRPASIAAFEQTQSIPKRLLARFDSLTQYIPLCLLLPLRVGPKKALNLLKSYWRIDRACWEKAFLQNGQK